MGTDGQATHDPAQPSISPHAARARSRACPHTADRAAHPPYTRRPHTRTTPPRAGWVGGKHDDHSRAVPRTAPHDDTPTARQRWLVCAERAVRRYNSLYKLTFPPIAFHARPLRSHAIRDPRSSPLAAATLCGISRTGPSEVLGLSRLSRLRLRLRHTRNSIAIACKSRGSTPLVDV